MEYIAGITDFKLHNSAVSLGKFDGIHLGHRLLIDKIISLKNEGYTSAVFSFHCNPRNLFSEKDMKIIYTEEEKKNKLEELGVDIFISYPFTKETASMEAEDFIREVLVEKMDAKVIVVGSDFRFGHERRGSVSLLKELSDRYGYEVIVLEKVKLDQHIVSSTMIRTELLHGNIPRANQLLGEPFSIVGEVVHGRMIGRTLGMPTTNLIPPKNKILPPNGVYASRVRVEGKLLDSVTSIGHKPSVGADPVRGVETYIFDFSDEIYGEIIEVQLYGFERPEVKFDSLQDLSNQMHKDIIWAKEYLSHCI